MFSANVGRVPGVQVCSGMGEEWVWGGWREAGTRDQQSRPTTRDRRGV